MSTWDDSVSFSSFSEPFDGAISENGRPSLRLHGRTLSNESSTYSQDTESSRNLERANEIVNFRELRQHHERERDRFLVFLSKQRQTITFKHEDRRREIIVEQEGTKDKLEDKVRIALIDNVLYSILILTKFRISKWKPLLR